VSEQALAAQRAVTVTEALVARAQLAVAECRIVTPQAGVIERVYFDPGELVSLGARVARVIRTQTVRATFYVPNAELGRVRVGQPVVVVADAFGEREFTGRVRRVGLEAEFTPRNVQTRSDRDRLVFPAEVDIENADAALRAGMPVTVTLGDGS
jgi:HlyD family secretion protein